MAQIFNRIITMKTAENLTALLKSQEQTLRDAVLRLKPRRKREPPLKLA